MAQLNRSVDVVAAGALRDFEAERLPLEAKGYGLVCVCIEYCSFKIRFRYIGRPGWIVGFLLQFHLACLESLVAGCTTHQFGSSVNGFGSNESDMDIFLDLNLDKPIFKEQVKRKPELTLSPPVS
jgi:hypothetical protein